MSGRSIVAGLLALAVCQGVAAANNFAAALADLQAERDKIGGMTTVEFMTAVNEAFFARIDPSELEAREIAAIVRLNAFAYGDKAHALALATTKRLNDFAARPDVDGALAAALRVRLSGHAGVAAPTRNEWAGEYLRHPKVGALLLSEYGDLVLEVACSSARTDSEKEFMLGLARQLDASRSTAAAGAISTYWSSIVRLVPEGERRQALRGQLADYLAAALAIGKNDVRHAKVRENLENELALLNGPKARGQLLGGAAPEIHFIWSSREGLKGLSDLRGKVVVLDFWATWCGPCVASFPKVAELAARYRGFDVEVVSVTSVQGTIVGLRSSGLVDCKGDPEKEMRLMADYIKEREITWPVVFSRESVFNPDYGVQGIPNITTIAPDGTVRHSASGFSQAEEIKRIDTLLAEFRLRLPALPIAK